MRNFLLFCSKTGLSRPQIAAVTLPHVVTSHSVGEKCISSHLVSLVLLPLLPHCSVCLPACRTCISWAALLLTSDPGRHRLNGHRLRTLQGHARWPRSLSLLFYLCTAACMGMGMPNEYGTEVCIRKSHWFVVCEED